MSAEQINRATINKILMPHFIAATPLALFLKNKEWINNNNSGKASKYIDITVSNRKPTNKDCVINETCSFGGTDANEEALTINEAVRNSVKLKIPKK